MAEGHVTSPRMKQNHMITPGTWKKPNPKSKQCRSKVDFTTDAQFCFRKYGAFRLITSILYSTALITNRRRGFENSIFRIFDLEILSHLHEALWMHSLLIVGHFEHGMVGSEIEDVLVCKRIYDVEETSRAFSIPFLRTYMYLFLTCFISTLLQSLLNSLQLITSQIALKYSAFLFGIANSMHAPKHQHPTVECTCLLLDLGLHMF
ncbi:hypothetical protein DID88_008938 [Monilinia fructigena]|nr:hypothetical protein DID88_008938 [Monilinia fructigena]